MSLPRFLADEDLRLEIVHAVRRLNPLLEFATIQELQLRGLADQEVLAFAAEHGWIVVSHDVNTMRAAAQMRVSTGEPMQGLFLVPQARGTREVAESLALIEAATTLDEWLGRIVYLPI